MSGCCHPRAELLQFRTAGLAVLQLPPPRYPLAFHQDAILRLNSCHDRSPFHIRACARSSRNARLICFSTILIDTPQRVAISRLLNPWLRLSRNTCRQPGGRRPMTRLASSSSCVAAAKCSGPGTSVACFSNSHSCVVQGRSEEHTSEL